MRAAEPKVYAVRHGHGRARGFAAAPLACQRAFTLIEVMVALVVVSLGMLGVIQAVGQTASTSSYLREKTLAHWVAMNRLTEARLQKGAPAIDKSSDEVEMGGRRWRWTMEVKQTPVETIRRIDISVRAADADKNSSLASVTGFYGAAVAPPGAMLIAWEGADDGPPTQEGEQPDSEKQDDDEDRPSDELPPLPEEPPPLDEPIDPIDPSDPSLQK